MANYLGKLGFMFRVGLYNFYGYSAGQTNKTNSGSELYYSRLKSKLVLQSGSKETKAFHKEKYGNEDYFNVELNITRESIKEWIKVSKLMGATYVIITVKELDGYCLWDTNCKDVKIHKSKTDIVRIFKEEAMKEGLLVGFYYSWTEKFVKIDTEYFLNRTINEMQELIRYRPDFFFFDNDKNIEGPCTFIIDVILDELKESGILYNNKIGDGRTTDVDIDYTVYENDEIPDDEQMSEWQYYEKIGKSIGYDPEQKDENFKSGDDLNIIFNMIDSLGGTLCINISTDADGVIDGRESNSLFEFYNLKI